jgi:hypothetical protein
MQPRKQALTVAALDVASGFANGHWALPPERQAVPLFFQKDGEQHRQRPKAHQSLDAHELNEEFLFTFVSVSGDGLRNPCA